MYHYEGAMLNYLQRWIDQLRWQRLKPFRKLAIILLDHLDGILNYCRTKVRLGVVEAINWNIKSLLRRGRGYKNLRICCSRPSGWLPRKSNSWSSGKRLKLRLLSDSCTEPNLLRVGE